MIEIACPHCRESFHIPEDCVGKRGQCPACRQILLAEATSIVHKNTQAQDMGVVGVDQDRAEKTGQPDLFQYACPNCESILNISSKYRGQRGRCKRCSTYFQVPEVESGSKEVEQGKPLLQSSVENSGDSLCVPDPESDSMEVIEQSRSIPDASKESSAHSIRDTQDTAPDESSAHSIRDTQDTAPESANSCQDRVALEAFESLRSQFMEEHARYSDGGEYRALFEKLDITPEFRRTPEFFELALKVKSLYLGVNEYLNKIYKDYYYAIRSRLDLFHLMWPEIVQILEEHPIPTIQIAIDNDGYISEEGRQTFTSLYRTLGYSVRLHKKAMTAFCVPEELLLENNFLFFRLSELFSKVPPEAHVHMRSIMDEYFRKEKEAQEALLAEASQGSLEKPNRYITTDVKRAVWRRDEGRCVECGSRELLEYDHIIPVSKGGSSTERNVQLLCETCNRNKGDTIR